MRPSKDGKIINNSRNSNRNSVLYTFLRRKKKRRTGFPVRRLLVR